MTPPADGMRLRSSIAGHALESSTATLTSRDWKKSVGMSTSTDSSSHTEMTFEIV